MRGLTTEEYDAWRARRREPPPDAYAWELRALYAEGREHSLLQDCVRYSTRLGTLQKLVGQLEREGRLTPAERRAFAGALR